MLSSSDKINKVIHEYRLDSNSIPDIYIETDNEIFFCEIKLNKITEDSVYQAIRYFNTIENNFKNQKIGKKFNVYLIGKQISDQLRFLAEKNGITIKIIGKDMDESIKICKNCRKAYSSRELKCSFCNSEEVMKIINLLSS